MLIKLLFLFTNFPTGSSNIGLPAPKILQLKQNIYIKTTIYLLLAGPVFSKRYLVCSIAK